MNSFFSSLRILPRWIIILIDFSLLFISVVLAFILRFNFQVEEVMKFPVWYGVCIFMVSGFLSILATQSYAGIIRYTSLQDGVRVALTLSWTVILVMVINYFIFYSYDLLIVPLSVIIIAYFASLILLISYRLLVKYLFNYYSNAIRRHVHSVIFGAGKSGLITKQIIESDTSSRFKVFAFLEDDPRKVGKFINGIKVFSAKKDIENVIVNFKVSVLILAIQDLSLERKNEIADICLKYNVKLRSVPNADKWVKGELSLNQIKNVRIEDLLGREAIILNGDKVRKELEGKKILITGAAGSIGSEVVNQILNFAPASVILLDQSETGLYELQRLILLKNKSKMDIALKVADISNYRKLELIFKQYKPNYVFHAAAYKHVPMMENNPGEAVLCNISGTKNLADLSVKYMVQKFVMISTDKAVNPTNVMGASKRIAEIYVQSLNQLYKKLNTDSPKFITTRFGNVLGSNGSVIPLFRKQIETGGPVTVTDPDITRYFMTIPEACQLVLEAGTMGKGGEIFLFDMGKSVKIIDLAKKMIQLSGLTLGKDIEITYTGLREGEKLYEELLNNEENTLPTHHPKIMIAKVRPEEFDHIQSRVEELIELSNGTDELKMVALMKQIVPEYISNSSRFEVLDKRKEEDMENVKL